MFAIALARKPLRGTTLVESVCSDGAGALNIELSRVPVEGYPGRWPPNLLFASRAAVADLDAQSGIIRNTSHFSYQRSGGEFINNIPDQPEQRHWRVDEGGASRLFHNFDGETSWIDAAS